MLQITDFYHGHAAAVDRLTLPYELRQKSRLHCQLDSGVEAGIFLERGSMLRGGDLLLAKDGRIVEVVAAPEMLSVVATSDVLQLMRAAYHLGNRHVSVQVLPGSIRYIHDHVLDDMLIGMGLSVRFDTLPFEPEGGAYGRQEHTQSHDHSHHH